VYRSHFFYQKIEPNKLGVTYILDINTNTILLLTDVHRISPNQIQFTKRFDSVSLIRLIRIKMLLLPVAYINLLHANTKCIHHCSSLHSPHLSCRKKGQ